MNIHYHRNKCIGCGICATKASFIWVVSASDGKADLLDSVYKKQYFVRKLWPDESAVMHDIVSCCPTKAIQVR